MQVELLGLHPDQVAVRPRDDDTARRAVMPVGPLFALKRPAEARDLDLDVLRGAFARVIARQLVNERVDRDGLVRVQQQHRQERALLASPQAHRMPLIRDLQVAEDAEVHTSRYLRCDSRRKRC